MTGHFAQSGDENKFKGTIYIIKPVDPKAVSPPASYENFWSNKTTGATQEATFYHVIPPAGYVALGDIICLGS